MQSLEDALRDKRILIIDDLVDARSALKKMMTLLGANIIDTANDGRQASELITEHHYDIILSDYNLESGKDGQQILEEARYSNRLKASSLFIMVTGENAIEMVMGALEYEPDNYITCYKNSDSYLNFSRIAQQQLAQAEAIITFDRAVRHQEASASVLMNAIQTKISYIEKHGTQIDYLKDCYQYFKRIGAIDSQDNRYQRFSTLKNTFAKLWQNAGLH